MSTKSNTIGPRLRRGKPATEAIVTKLKRAAASEPRPTHEGFLRTKTFGSLDGLRAIAIMVVVWHHAATPVAGWRVTERGFLGVDLFFVISGFLIVTLLLRERRRSGDISLRDFYVRRFLRIFPPFYFMLLLVGAAAWLRPGSGSAAIRHDLPYAAFYVSNMVVLQSMLAISWSLSVEEQFYLVVPTLEKYLHRILPLLLAVLYLLAVLPTFGYFPSLYLPHFFRETTFGPILLGVMLAFVLDDRRGFDWASRTIAQWFVPLLAVVLVIAAASHPAEDISGWPRLAVHWSLLLLVAACVVRERNVLRPVLTSWPMRRIGMVSYGIYLYHLIVMHFVAAGLKNAGVSSGRALFSVTALATWFVAEVSYRHFEVRFLSLKARLAPAASVRPTGAPAIGSGT